MSSEANPLVREVVGGELIPRGWKSVFLGDICSKVTTGKLDANAMKANGAFPFFTCAREVYRIDSYAFDGEALLVSGNGANVGYIHHYAGKFNAYQRTYVLLGFKVDVQFIRYFLEENLASRISGEARYGNTPYITMDTLTQMSIDIPESPIEARRIATVLSDVDSLISSLERLIAKKQAIKQGMMQELLTGKTRLLGCVEPWKDSSLNDLARVAGGGTPPTNNSSYWGGEIQWFTPAEILAGGSGEVYRSNRTISREGLAASGAHLHPTGTVLVTSRASIGLCAVAGTPVATNQGFTSLVPYASESTWFLYYWIQYNRDELVSRAAGSTFLEISARRVALIPISSPSLREQAAIGSSLRDLDDELNGLIARLHKTLQIKQGMMQELLTGRTRLTPSEVAA